MRIEMRTVSCLLIAAAAATSWAQQSAKTVSLTLGRGELVQFSSDIVRVAVAEPKIADAIVVSPREVMIAAKGVGKTTVAIWQSSGSPNQYEINVLADTETAEQFRRDFGAELKAVTPDAGIIFNGNAETMVLTGNAPTVELSKKAEALASTRSRKVINLINVPPPADPRQILLQVRFASIERAALSEIGFNFFSRDPKFLGAGTTQQFQQPRFSQLQFQNQEFANSTINFADLLNLFVFRPDLNIGATIRALASRNLLQILAEPNLITLEGKEASFLAGGQFPFPTLTATTTGGAVAPVVTVQFKNFGVELGFTPTVTASGAIHLKVAPQVTALDFQNAVSVQGTLIPAIAARKAETEVILRDGESFAIAGLIDNRVQSILNRVRGLGDIPILGFFFRSKSLKKSNDELLVVVTPRFVKPLPADEKVKLPDMMETFLPTVSEEQAAKLKKPKQKKPQVVGESGYQKPKK
jgi:pilus assembly protein CpaC